MSGDVQPRRRKDKKKKRVDEGISSGEDNPPPPPEPQWSGASGGEWMHTQSDHGTGGHWCAKIVFFLLLAVLVALISLIILENRGLQDLEEREVSESRYAAVFHGWLEDEPHDDHHDPHTLELTHPEEEEDDHDEHESDLDDEIEEIEKEDDSAEHDDDDNDTDNDKGDDDEDDNDTDDDKDDDDEDDQNSEVDDADDNEDTLDDDDKDIDGYRGIDDENDSDKDDDNNRENDDTDNDEQGDDDDDNDDDDDDDDDDNGQRDEDNDVSVERRIRVEYVRYDKPLEEVDDDDIEEVIDNHAAEEEHLARISAEQDDDLETSNMGLKFGVGVALVVVAHWVLVRKWRNDRNNETVDGTSNGRRRLTLVEDGEEPENSLSTIRKTIASEARSIKPVVSFAPQNIFLEEEDSANDGNTEDLSEEETITTKVLTNVLSPVQCQPRISSDDSNGQVDEENEISEEDEEEEEEEEGEGEIVEKINIKDSKVPDRELVSEEEDEKVDETDDVDDYEHVDEEETLDEEQAVDEEDEISDVDDEELMKKLEQKYGKLTSDNK